MKVKVEVRVEVELEVEKESSKRKGARECRVSIAGWLANRLEVKASGARLQPEVSCTKAR